MANRYFHPFKAQGVGHVTLNFTFLPQGAGAPVLGEGCAGWCTVARTGAGSFTITLTDSYAALVAGNVTIAMNAATDLTPQWGAIDVTTAKTLVLNTLAVAVPTDIAANANNKVHVQLILRNSSVLP